MRVVMVSPTIGDAFGQERVMRDSAGYLRQRGAHVYFVGDILTGQLPECDGHRLVPGISSFHNLSARAKVTAAHAEVLQYLDETRADVVHLIDQFDARLERAIARRYPTILSAHTVAPTCPSSTRLNADGTICESRSGWRCLMNHHRQRCLSFLKSDLHRAHAIHNYQLRRRGLDEAHAVIAISRYLERLLVADGWPPEKVRLVYNPVTVPVRPLPLIDVPENLIVCAARLVPMKGIDRLLRALVPIQAERWTLWICGEGGERAALERLRDALGLRDRVAFRGRVPYAEMPRLLAASRCLVQPNLGPEGFGLSVAEASAIGVPVVAFRVPALDEIIADGETGLLARPGDTEDLSRQLRRALTDETFIARCRERGPRRIAELFSIEAHGEATWRVYEECLGMNSVSATRHSLDRR